MMNVDMNILDYYLLVDFVKLDLEENVPQLKILWYVRINIFIVATNVAAKGNGMTAHMI
tara:strand:- start:2588 stop:2764 length:177 start_codon:yes stop_codon:yes gene_type:complete